MDKIQTEETRQRQDKITKEIGQIQRQDKITEETRQHQDQITQIEVIQLVQLGVVLVLENHKT